MSKPFFMDEAQIHRLITPVKKGDKVAFEMLMDVCYGYVERLTVRILRKKEDAEEAIQNTFVKLWQSLQSYDEKQKFSTWLYRIAVNASLDILRREQRFAGRREEMNRSEGKELTPPPDVVLLEKETEEVLRDLSGILTPKQRAVFVLRDLERVPTEEVAEVLQMTSDQVKSNLYHARKKIREKIRNYDRKEYL